MYSSEFYPSEMSRTDKWHAEKPIPGVADGDAFCIWLNKRWWDYYEPKREKARLSKSGPEHERRDFTRYPSPPGVQPPRPPVPVESFLGQNFRPYDNDGFRSKNWGCFVGCQNTQKTLEWVIAIRLMKERQVRARYMYAFLCPEGQISVVYQEKTIREHDTPEEIEYALGVMQSEFVRKSFVLRDESTIHGDRSQYLAKCGCFDDSRELRGFAEHQIKTRGRIAGIRDQRQVVDRSGRPFPSTDGKQQSQNFIYRQLTQRPKPRLGKAGQASKSGQRAEPRGSQDVPKRTRNEAESSQQPNQRPKTAEERQRDTAAAQDWRIEDIDVGIDWRIEDFDFMPENETGWDCRDFQNPRLAGSYDPDDGDANDALDATLRVFAEFSNRDMSWDVLGKGKGHGY